MVMLGETIKNLSMALLSFTCALIASCVIFGLSKYDLIKTILDSADGPQKLHFKNVPRIGGVGIAVACSIVIIGPLGKGLGSVQRDILLMLISAAPVFFIGLLEDCNKNLSIKIRLIFALLSALIVSYFFNLSVSNIGIPLLAHPLSLPIIGFLLACFCIVGAINAYNIIDGLNGLTSIFAVISFSAIAFIANLLDNQHVLVTSLVLIGSVMGFFVLNYPFGLIFLGDCGSYFLGFMVATLGIFLVDSHPRVSPWFPIVLNFYPIFETLFSIYRRKVLKNINPSAADRLHLHTLVFRRVMGQKHKPYARIFCANSRTSALMSIIGLVPALFALVFWDNNMGLIICFMLFSVIYIYLYKSIVTFKIR